MMITVMSCLNVSGQTRDEKIDILNSYIELLNASVHGLQVAHVMMEGYNRVINEYVDINSNELIQISNKDLPQNLFGGTDAELFFYVKSSTPEALAEIAKRNGSKLELKLFSTLNFHVDKLIDILGDINRIRFDVENFIKTYDLNDRQAIYDLYIILERAEKLYSDYASVHHMIAELVKSNAPKVDDNMVISMQSVHRTTKIIYSSFRRGEGKNSQRNINQLFVHFKNFEAGLKQHIFNTEARALVNDIVQDMDSVEYKLMQFELGDAVPLRYTGYGKFYAYHHMLLAETNFTGPGYFKHMIDLLYEMDIKALHFDDEPPIYKVLYPEKKDEIEGLSEKASEGITPVDRDIRQRRMEFSNQVIEVEGDYLEIELSDHQMMDRDSVTLEFNGEIVLENHLLSRVPIPIRLEIDRNKNNVLIVHAVNLGIIPPNTVAIAYRYKGERKRIVVESNLSVSGAIRVDLNEN
ncbi:MAG: hypothetical protein HKN09_09735 [Saprospiraceae bacterium]|nr:hypothetical protein [Saprospiraceae bacterium]